MGAGHAIDPAIGTFIDCERLRGDFPPTLAETLQSSMSERREAFEEEGDSQYPPTLCQDGNEVVKEIMWKKEEKEEEEMPFNLGDTVAYTPLEMGEASEDEDDLPPTLVDTFDDLPPTIVESEECYDPKMNQKSISNTVQEDQWDDYLPPTIADNEGNEKEIIQLDALNSQDLIVSNTFSPSSPLLGTAPTHPHTPLPSSSHPYTPMHSSSYPLPHCGQDTKDSQRRDEIDALDSPPSVSLSPMLSSSEEENIIESISRDKASMNPKAVEDDIQPTLLPSTIDDFDYTSIPSRVENEVPQIPLSDLKDPSSRTVTDRLPLSPLISPIKKECNPDVIGYVKCDSRTKMNEVSLSSSGLFLDSHSQLSSSSENLFSSRDSIASTSNYSFPSHENNSEVIKTNDKGRKHGGGGALRALSDDSSSEEEFLTKKRKILHHGLLLSIEDGESDCDQDVLRLKETLKESNSEDHVKKKPDNDNEEKGRKKVKGKEKGAGGTGRGRGRGRGRRRGKRACDVAECGDGSADSTKDTYSGQEDFTSHDSKGQVLNGQKHFSEMFAGYSNSYSPSTSSKIVNKKRKFKKELKSKEMEDIMCLPSADVLKICADEGMKKRRLDSESSKVIESELTLQFKEELEGDAQECERLLKEAHFLALEGNDPSPTDSKDESKHTEQSELNRGERMEVKERKVYISSHFIESEVAKFKTMIEDLGGSVVTDVTECTEMVLLLHS